MRDNIDAMICNISLSEIKSDHSYPLEVYLRMRERECVKQKDINLILRELECVEMSLL